MRPTTISDEEYRSFQQPAERRVIAAPDDIIGEYIEPVEAVLTLADPNLTSMEGERLLTFWTKIELTDDDLYKLLEGRSFWLGQIGLQMQPFVLGRGDE